MGEMNWRQVFYPDTPLLEIFLRGTVTYLAIFTLLRLVLRRESSGLGITDVLVVVLIADAAQNAMAGGYQSLADGVMLVGVIVFWAWALDWLAFRYPAAARLVRPPKLQLVEDGRPLWRNMAREFVTIEELRSALARRQDRPLWRSIKHLFPHQLKVGKPSLSAGDDAIDATVCPGIC